MKKHSGNAKTSPPSRVPPTGSLHSQVMVVGSRPGPTELETGRAFSGAAGQLVRSVVDSILVRAYLTNLVKVSAVTGRETPIKDSTVASEVTLVSPLVVVTLGADVTSYMRDTKHSIKTVHGLLMPTERFGHQFYVLPLYDAGYIIRCGGLESPQGQDWLADWEELRRVDGLRDFQTHPKSRTRD